MRLTVLILMLLITGCVGPVKELYPEDEQQRPVEMFLVSHGWHVGIAVEAEYVSHYLPEHSEMPEALYLKFGWGDGRYYPDRDPGFGTLLSAAFLPTRSVIQVVGVDIPLHRYFSASTIVKVNVSEEGVEKFAEFVADRFRLNDEGEVQKAADGYYANSTFFDANGRYYLPKTSNVWTARALRQTGFPISTFYTFTSGNVIRQARKEGELIQ